MTEFSRSHLTTREIEEAAAGTLSAVRQAHADQCAQCAEAIEDYRFVAARMPRGETSLEDAGGCPAAEDLALACSGSLAGPEAARVIEHASSCGRCGAILRVVMEEEPAPVAAVKPRRRTLWLAAAAALALGFIGLFLWFQERHDPRRLLAMAYTESRPFDLRLRDNGYGPVRQQRAGSASALDRPRALVQAEGDIQGRPESAETLLLRGRAELLEGQYDAAIESLTRAQETRKGNAEAMADLGCAYLLRGDTENRAIDYGHGLDYLRGAVKLQPNDVRILFDLALAYERTALLEAAIETWKRYLALEKDAGWAAEARQRLGGIEARVKKVLGWRQRVQPDPTAFLAMARADAGAVDAEQFQDIAWRYWLPASAENTQARAAFTTLARMFVERFGDTSLADSATGGTTAGLEMLGQAIGKDAEGAYDEALPLARNAARVLEESANRAAALRARVEMVNSRARAPSAECLAVTAPVRKALAGTKYRWMLAQTTIQEGICSLRGGLSGAARQLYREAEEATRKQGLRILWLRVTGMQGDQAQLTGDEVGVWEIAETGLKGCWENMAPPARANQFDDDLLQAADRLGWFQAAAAFGLAGVREETQGPNRVVEAMVRRAIVPILQASGELAEARQQLAAAEAIFARQPQGPTMAALRANGRLAMAEILPATDPARSAELRSILPGLEGGSWQTQLRVRQALGGSLLAQGDYPGATQAFRESIAIQQRQLDSVTDSLTRLASAEMAADSYRGLVEIQLGRDRDASRSLETWKRFRQTGTPSAPIARKLPHDAAELRYAVISSGVAAWLVRDGVVDGKILKIPAGPAREMQQRFLRACARPDADRLRLRNDARQLYAWLLDPFASQLQGVRWIAIDPDDWIAAIPFAALIDRTGRYAAERWSIGMGRADEPAAIARRTPALIVSAAGSSASGSDEARAVAAEFDTATIVTDGPAIRAAMDRAARDFGLLHFVGHGWANGGDGGLILPGQEDLTAKQLSRYRWNECRLVVLSACMTGTGETLGPFNPRSIVRAFLAGGAQAVVASRWNVDGAATARLMRTFYHGLAAGAPAGEALAEAERALLQDPATSLPYYWAAFSIFSNS